MYLVIEIDPNIQFLRFNWEFHYEVILHVKHAIIWYVVLHVEEEEWMNLNLPRDCDLRDEVYWFNLCNEEELE